MTKTIVSRSLRTAVLVAVFGLGYVFGTIQQPAEAQFGGLGGALSTAKELGSSIVEMQEHVNGLQKNIDTLKKVQSSLTGK